MKSLFQNIFFKMGMIFILIIILLIPAIMVQDLIQERMMRQEEAVDEVSSKHARGQELTGPVLTIPYVVTSTTTDRNGNVREVKKRHNYHILPEELDISGKIDPEKRKRGLFEVVVYGTDLKFSGMYKKPKLDEEGISYDQLLLDQAFISLGISDLKGVTDQVKINLGGKKLECDPGLISSDVVSTGLHVRYPMDTITENLKFDFDLSLNGSEHLMFTPIGKVTKVHLESPWSEPSFDGNFLPEMRKVSDKGFTADWKVLHLNRNYPQGWTGTKYSVRATAFGVNLRLPVDVYQKSMRVAKYAMLFIVLTYLVFFFVEVLNKILIHPIQYILVGIALVLFYILMLAFSEQIYFDLAYLLAAIMTISLVFLYCRSIFKSWGLAAMTVAILSILYGFIFIIIQMQDYALLFGSLGVFCILAVTMYFSRKIDWFNIQKEDEPQDAS